VAYVNIHTHILPKTTDNSIAVYNVFAQDVESHKLEGYVSVGLHPWHIHEGFENDLKRLADFALSKNVLAIGEAGLDKLCATSFDVQEHVFKQQADLASRLRKPMILHAVRSFGEILRIRQVYAESPSWIIHGFRGSIHIARELVGKGFYLSFGSYILNSNEKDFEIVKAVPVSNMFLETDDKEVGISGVYKFVSAAKKMNEEALKKAVFDNFNTVFLKSKNG